MKYTGDRISVSEAADMLGMWEQQVRILMKRGELDIGHIRQTNRRCTYYIYKNKVEEWKNKKTIIFK